MPALRPCPYLPRAREKARIVMARKSVELVRMEAPNQCSGIDLASIPREVTDDDLSRFREITSIELSSQQREWVVTPPKAFPMQSEVLAVHWHPEFVSMDLIRQRIASLYPNMQQSLIIPTQHNELLEWDEHAGVEVDCYSSGFNRKVQLLLHFRKEKLVEKSDVLKGMLAHTFQYRSSQLFEFMDALTEEQLEERRQVAAAETGADEELVEFCALYVLKLREMLEQNWRQTPECMVKNKLIRNFFNTLIDTYDKRVIQRAQIYLKAVKGEVKKHFSLKYFYRASEIIEEARSLGAGVVIPHPEQFWPILLADYDVDGYEIWNPQSREYTEFLISVVRQQNASLKRNSRPLLVFMGDDCHMGEKTLPQESRDPEKGSREIGYQPAWEDMAVRKELVVSGFSRSKVIEEYAARLS